jgi:hypothetical protein
MRGFERFGELGGNGQGLVDRHRSRGQPIRERRALDQLENQRARRAGVLDAVDGGDVRMIDRREQLCLAREPREVIAIGSEPSGRILSATSRPSLVSRAR